VSARSKYALRRSIVELIERRVGYRQAG
jgi:hypothetical protein